MTTIERWMRAIFLSDGITTPFTNLHYFQDIVTKLGNEVTKPEHIFLHLYNKGLITGHRKLIETKKEELASGILPVSFLDIRFHLTDLGVEFINDIIEWGGDEATPSLKNFEFDCRNGIQLEIPFELNADGTVKSLDCRNGLASQEG